MIVLTRSEINDNDCFDKVWLHYFSGGPEELLAWGGGDLLVDLSLKLQTIVIL